jgi:5-methylcytosine-specific restriction endonuclease McrA
MMGRVWTLEQREKTRASHLGKPHPHRGHPVTEESKKKMSASKCGKSTAWGNVNCPYCSKPIHSKKGMCYSCWTKVTKPCLDCGQPVHLKFNLCKNCSQKKRYESHEELKKNSERQKEAWARPGYLETRSGSNHPMWRGGIHIPYDPEFRNNLRETIRKRDDYLCQSPGCYLPQNGRRHSVHHIDYNRQNSNPVNLITLCVKCHAKTSVGDRICWTDYYQDLQELRRAKS